MLAALATTGSAQKFRAPSARKNQCARDALRRPFTRPAVEGVIHEDFSGNRNPSNAQSLGASTLTHMIESTSFDPKSSGKMDVLNFEIIFDLRLVTHARYRSLRDARVNVAVLLLVTHDFCAGFFTSNLALTL